MELSRVMKNKNLLEIKDLQTYFYVRGYTAKALDKVSLTIKSGQTLGLVGESGCGKSVTAHSIMRLIPDPPGRIESGEIFFDNQDLLKVSEARMRRIRGNRISMIFQEPMTSLNPVFPVGDQVGEVIRLHQGLSRRSTRERVIEMFQLVGIPAAKTRLFEYPHQLSGVQSSTHDRRRAHNCSGCDHPGSNTRSDEQTQEGDRSCHTFYYA